MRSRFLACGALVASLLAVPAHADVPVPVQNEISSLLATVAASGCEFWRNGTWYDAQRAQAHLRDKYRYLAARNLVDTTEQFIDRAASESSVSGDPYRIRCGARAAVDSRQWLREKLSRLRAAH
jgi:ATP-dependent DNA ligase